ncbi:hypothetical protein Tdes44962_MAKER01449 [Teratosphaeria destructans]|uniref:Uncharacterized protein n=1 Tax=Teratosphaeria destructans TaxID=418781 RepID=A0A9W7W6A4_9PEZI|nr:hypothetical protein Tdes44962_MAKER01449 [Teratosphaeria destructans]
MSYLRKGDDSVDAKDFANAPATRPAQPNTGWSFESRKHRTRSRRGGSSARGPSYHHRSGLPDWPLGVASAHVADGPPESALQAAMNARQAVILEGLGGAAEVKQSRASLHRRLSVAGGDLQGEAAPPVSLSDRGLGDGAEQALEAPTTRETFDLEAPDVVYGGHGGLSPKELYPKPPAPRETQRSTSKDVDPNAPAPEPPAPIHEAPAGDRDRDKFTDFLQLLKTYYVRRHQSQSDQTIAIRAAVREHLSLVPRGGSRALGFTEPESTWLAIAQDEEARIAAWARERRVGEARGREAWDRIWDGGGRRGGGFGNARRA